MEKPKCFNESVQMYNHLSLNHCLCLHGSKKVQDLWQNLFEGNFRNLDDELKLEGQLLSLSIVRLIEDIFTHLTANGLPICAEIYSLVKVFSSDQLWETCVNYLHRVTDKHLHWLLIKSMSSILYSSPQVIFQTRIQSVFDILKDNEVDKKVLSALQLISSLIGYDRKSSCFVPQYITCKNSTLVGGISPTELSLVLCSKLSLAWDSFFDEFQKLVIGSSKCRTEYLLEFLFLWKRLSEKHLESELSSKIFNTRVILHFFSAAYSLPILALHLYVDIVLHVIRSGMQKKNGINLKVSEIGEAIACAINQRFLQLLPTCEEDPSFIGGKREEMSFDLLAHERKCDKIIMKKVSSVILTALAEVDNELIVCNIAHELMNFLRTNSDLAAGRPAYSWLLNIFFEDDELLFDVILAILKIYATLKAAEKRTDLSVPLINISELKNDLNVHKIFIDLLQKLGYDYNELLAFLTSDETCFLLYLVQYLKLLINEFDSFVQAHLSLFHEKESSYFLNFKLSHPRKSINRTLSASVERKTETIVSKGLVSYSSSSSEDSEERAFKEDEVEDNSPCVFVEKSVSVLVNLRFALQKLYDAKEFPYNSLPLINLLKDCEQCWLLHKNLLV